MHGGDPFLFDERRSRRILTAMKRDDLLSEMIYRANINNDLKNDNRRRDAEIISLEPPEEKHRPIKGSLPIVHSGSCKPNKARKTRGKEHDSNGTGS